MSVFHATIITSFPQIFPGGLQYSLAGQGLKNGIWSYEVVDLKQFGIGKHRNIDDTPFGGGNGMVIRSDVLAEAIDFSMSKKPASEIFYMSPRGHKLSQIDLHEIKDKKSIIIICGRFEGIDERIISEYNVKEISIGDYVLSGGDLAAMVLLDGCIRLLPGILQNQETLAEESFCISGEMQGLLEYPLYTRPAVWRGIAVPEVLTSGDHAKIQKWRMEQALAVTKNRRPDLLC